MPHQSSSAYQSSSGKGDERRQQSYKVRQEAASLAAEREHEPHHHNHDEHRYRTPSNHLSCVASFTKGLPHDRETGLLLHSGAFALFTQAVETGIPEDIRSIPLGPPPTGGRLFRSGISRSPGVSVRAWESMAAGLTFDLEGPDAQSKTMPPAPALASSETAFEIAELYWMALTRDIPFTHFINTKLIWRAIHSLNRMCWSKCARNPASHLTDAQQRRMRGPFDTQTVFRGHLPGDCDGPYISQFLLMGTAGIGGDMDPSEGFVQYGAMRMDQRVRVAARLDYMTTWESWLDVQNGADVRGRGSFAGGEHAYRFLTTPRDLATYVHFDALYQAYLNACVILLDMKAPFDAGMPFIDDDRTDKQQGFATFGGPHVLTLVTEVATRALKAVRYQKYNVHRRCRPEALGGLIERYYNEADNPLYEPIRPVYNALDEDMLRRVAALNGHYNSSVRDRGWPRHMDYDSSGDTEETRLLPMAYPEGSPMHPSYGAGHATVAGACVTILKAFFDCDWELPYAFVPTEDGRFLEDLELEEPLTVQGELNKLCSNISVGRNWAGVHYFSDFWESAILGEKVALGILEEQKLTYSEDFSMTVPLFDGSVREI